MGEEVGPFGNSIWGPRFVTIDSDQSSVLIRVFPVSQVTGLGVEGHLQKGEWGVSVKAVFLSDLFDWIFLAYQ